MPELEETVEVEVESDLKGVLVEAALERCSQTELGWQPRRGEGPKFHAKPSSPCPVGKKKKRKTTLIHWIQPSYLSLPVFQPILLNCQAPLSVFFFCFSPPSLSPSLSYNHTHTGISGIYRGVVIGLFFDARWEITGPRNRDKSTSETRVSALAYDLQTLARTSIAHVPGRPECTDAQQEHTCSTSVREENG